MEWKDIENKKPFLTNRNGFYVYYTMFF